MKASSPRNSDSLRRRAESKIAACAAPGPNSGEEDPRRLLHELQVHQIELEIQAEELRISQADTNLLLRQYTDIFEFAPIGYLNLDREGRIGRVNQAAARLLGGSPNQISGRSFAAFVTAREQQAFTAFLEDVFLVPGRKTYEASLLGGQGRELIVQFEASFSAGDEECRLVLIDLTEQRRAESKCRDLLKLETIGQLAGGVAHDFNNLLGVMIMEAELISLEQDLPADLQAGIQEICATAKKGANLTRQLLLFSRKQVMQRKLLDLNESISGVSRLLKRTIRENVELELRLWPGPLPILADGVMLDQLLINLAVNARDAMPKGGRLILETGTRCVSLGHAEEHRGASAGNRIWLSVTDTGCGISQEILKRIFEPFFTTKAVGEGTGLGLATVQGIVEQHQGWIEVDSELGVGSEFTVYFPVSSDLPAPAPSPELVAAKVKAGSTILLVEDEAGLRSATRRVLEKYSFHVMEAACGRSAQAIWHQHNGRIDVLVTDLVMPGGINGLTLAEEFQALKPELKVVFISGYGWEAEKGAPDFAQAGDLLQKPYSVRELIEKVRQAS